LAASDKFLRGSNIENRTPHKTSFYNMLDEGGQTHPSLDDVSYSVAKPLISLGKLPPQHPENSATWQTRPADLSPSTPGPIPPLEF
jgi:hypothetical protein